MSGFDGLEKMAAELLAEQAAAAALVQAEADKEAARVRGKVFGMADEIFKGLGLGDTPDERRTYELDGAVTYSALKSYRGVDYVLQVEIAPNRYNWRENKEYFDGTLTVTGNSAELYQRDGDGYKIILGGGEPDGVTKVNPDDTRNYAYFPMPNAADLIARSAESGWAELRTGIGLRLQAFDRFMRSRIDYHLKEQADEQAEAEANAKAAAERADALENMTPEFQIVTGLKRLIWAESTNTERDDYDGE
jgi:hypothetical protein